MSKKNIIKILFGLLLFTYFHSVKAIEKIDVINNFNSLETLKFDFTQSSFDKKERGVCYLKRPHFLKCLYEDKNQKELIINNRILIIYHKRYNKIYRYPLSKSFFLDILDRSKFSKLISNGKSISNDSFFEINYLAENKGEITIFSDKEKYDLKGWRFVDMNNNVTILEIRDYVKNFEIKKNFFLIPEENQ